MVKIYDVKDFSVVQTMTFSAPVLSVAASPDNLKVAVGMSDGMLSGN